MENELTWWEKATLNLLKKGSIPKHIAFIMDGNRRWAKQQGIHKCNGHRKGADILRRIVNLCYFVGIKQLTVYALSTDNLKREKSEVTYLMDLTRKVIAKMATKNEIFDSLGIKLNIIGNLELADKEVREELEKVTKQTATYSKFTLNVCFLYSSRDEVRSAVAKVSNSICKLQGRPEDEICTAFRTNIYKELMLTSEPDIVIRTGNDSRLSKFICFQSTNSEILFFKEKWPEMNFWSFLKIVFYYKLVYKSIVSSMP